MGMGWNVNYNIILAHGGTPLLGVSAIDVGAIINSRYRLSLAYSISTLTMSMSSICFVKLKF